MRRLAGVLLLACLWIAVAAPTTIDRFFGVVQLCQNLSTMQNNMRANVQIIQHSAETPGQPLFNNFPATQKAVRDLGTAFVQRLDLNAAIVTTYTADVQAGSAAIGVSFSDMTAVYNNLRNWALIMSTATITNQTQLDNGVTAILNNVPAAMLPF
jgi:hypothetical protein